MLLAAQASPGDVLGRWSEAVILTGVQWWSITSVDPATLLAFRCGGAWAQTPAQVNQHAADVSGRAMGKVLTEQVNAERLGPPSGPGALGRRPVERLDAAFHILLLSYPESEGRP